MASPLGQLILGSKSPTRQALLREMGHTFTVMTADIDEKAIRDTNPTSLVLAIAHAKATALLPRIAATHPHLTSPSSSAAPPPAHTGATPRNLLLAGDQVVVHGTRVLEKPRNADEAREFIRGYAESHATTVGSVVVVDLASGRRVEGTDCAEIYFREGGVPGAVVEELIESGEVFGCAGGLMVEHEMVAPYVDHIVGTRDSVMGLSKALVGKLLEEALRAR